MNNFPMELKHSSGAPLRLDPTRLLLAFEGPHALAEIEKLAATLDLELENGDDSVPVPGELVNHTDQRFWLRARREIDEARFKLIEQAATQLGLAFIGPVYRQLGEPGRRGLCTPLPHMIIVRLSQRAGLDPELLATVASASAVVKPVLRNDIERSRYLNGYNALIILNYREISAYTLKQLLDEENTPLIADVQFETMPLLTPTSIVPSDTLFASQWDMVRIQAGGAGTSGWDIGTGAATAVVCVLDTGCDLGHPDLRFSTPGINLGTMLPDGAPTGDHGTACAGIVAAVFDNALGVAGVAGNARIMPVAFKNWTDVEVAAGITWATANGAGVISMSFGNNSWSHAIIDPAIQVAFNNNVVMCVATHNYNSAITYPATNALVMAVGASDEIDNRKSPSSPDGEGWGSNFGAQISVVAPGVHIPTTDRRGADGYHHGAGAAGDYTLTFNGTSSATPHVAGLAALIRSQHPGLTGLQVRALIEQTAQKVGAAAYANAAGHPNHS